MAQTMMQNIHVCKGLDAVANAFAGTVGSNVFNMQGYETCLFIYHKAVGASGTATITVEACDNISPTNHTAIPFYYKTITSGDTDSVLTKATSAGFTTTAGSSQLYLIEVRNTDLCNVASGARSYVRLLSTEVVSSAVLGGIIGLLCNPRIPQDVQATAIV